MTNLINSRKIHESFVDHVYQDSLGKDTLGYGTLRPITKEEASLLLEYRLNKMISELIAKESFYTNLPETKAEIVAEMVYQMGVGGVLKFKKMWKALKIKDYEEASLQMLDSTWAKQTPNRAIELAKRMRNHSL